MNDNTKHGSFTEVSRLASQAAIELGIYSNSKDADHIIFIDAFNVDKIIEGKKVIPWLVSEYNFAFKPVVDNLIKNNTFCLSISDQTTKSFIDSGLPENLIKTVHLGANPQMWSNLNQRQRKAGQPIIYITNNSSNNRSGYPDLIPAFLDFAKGKNVKLIIKDQDNQKFHAVLREIDKENKIIYENRNLSYEKLVQLYNIAHFGLYVNSCTSFGLTILEKALCGLPMIVSNASAIPEFTSNETVNYVDCSDQIVDNLLLAQWSSWGLVNNLPTLSQYPGNLIAPRPKYDSILENLEYSYKNYDKLVSKNTKFVQDIKNQWTWQHSIEKIVNILKDK